MDLVGRYVNHFKVIVSIARPIFETKYLITMLIEIITNY